MKFQLVSKHCLITGLIQQNQLAKDKKYTFCFLLSHFDVIIGYVKLKMKACYNDLSRRQFPNCPVTLGFSCSHYGVASLGELERRLEEDCLSPSDEVGR